MENRIRMYFAAFGDWPTPDQVSAIVGREPTRFAPQGAEIHRSTILRKKSIWEIDSGQPVDADVEEHLTALLSLLEPHAVGLRKLRESADIGIECAAYWHTSQPGFHLSEKLIARMAALGVSLDFDMYCMGEE